MRSGSDPPLNADEKGCDVVRGVGREDFADASGRSATSGHPPIPRCAVPRPRLAASGGHRGAGSLITFVSVTVAQG
jgi:hypothetical protein